jgi:hypothetical protein
MQRSFSINADPCMARNECAIIMELNKKNCMNASEAFDLWRDYLVHCKSNENAFASWPAELTKSFQKIAVEGDIDCAIRCGLEHGFAPVSVLNMLILHGGYPRMQRLGVLERSSTRFIDSLYQKTFPDLMYNTGNADILSPWITLSAQEALLDLSLQQYTVIEYGSGISSFFFSKEAFLCFSFEDDEDPAGKNTWTKEMNRQSERLGISINLIKPDRFNWLPETVARDLWAKETRLLVFIVGGDRCKYLKAWTAYLQRHRDQDIVLLIDNSEIACFASEFDILTSSGASVYHHYGYVYGQFVTKQCTSFATYNPRIMHLNGSAPYSHSKRWGKMNMQ